MRTGLALTAVAAVYPIVDRATTHLLADHVRAGHPTYSRLRIDAAVTTYLVLWSVVGMLGAGQGRAGMAPCLAGVLTVALRHGPTSQTRTDTGHDHHAPWRKTP